MLNAKNRPGKGGGGKHLADTRRRIVSTGNIPQQDKRLRYPSLTQRERELMLKNQNLARHVTFLLERNAGLVRLVREMEAAK